MKTVSWSTAGALVFGMLAYGVIKIVWWDIPVKEFENVIGIVAMIGAVLGAGWAHRRAPMPKTGQPGTPLGSEPHD